MAERRMFAKSVTECDRFLEMPASAQNLFFHLGMNADDEGFVGNSKAIMATCGAKMDDMRILIAKEFVFDFGGIILIRQWRRCNYIQSDRFRATIYQDLKALVHVDSKRGLYDLNANENLVLLPEAQEGKAQNGDVSKLYPECIHSIGKDRIGKDRIGKESVNDTHTQSFGEFGWVKLTEQEHQKLIASFGEEEVTRSIKYVDESAETSKNKNKWKNWYLVVRRSCRDGWGKHTEKSQDFHRTYDKKPEGWREL